MSFTDKDFFYVFSRVIKEEYGNMGEAQFKADFFKNKTIFIKSASSVWASELWTNKRKIIRKINQELGEEAVEEIKMK